MVKMGNVWDRTVEVLNGRGGMLAGIAFATLFIPGAVNAAYHAYAPATWTGQLLGALVMLGTTMVALWGQLALIAASSDPANDRAAAIRHANARWLPTLAVALALALLFMLVLVPGMGLLAFAGYDLTAMSRGVPQPQLAPGAGLGAVVYFVVALIAILFAGARMVPLYAVTLHERHGLGAIARAWRLTRRHTWRLVGVVLLFFLVLTIATWAAQSVSGLIARLVLGGDATATVSFIAATVAQAVSAALTLAAIVFSAQLYVALLAREAALHARAATRSEPPIADA